MSRKLERSKNAGRNIVFGLLNRTLTILFPFVTRTIVIEYIGMEYAGLGSLFTSVLTVLNLSELGFGGAIVYSMYRPIAEDDRETMCALLNYYRRIYRVIGCVILLLGIAISPFLPYLIKGTPPDEINIYVLFYLYLANTCISYLLFGYRNSLLSANQRNDIISNISSITNFALYLAQILILILTRNYYLFIAVMPVFTVLNNIMVAIISRRNYPDIICRGSISAELHRDIKKRVSGLMVTKICVTSRNAFDSIFISSFLGLAVSAAYGNYYMIMNSLISLIGVGTASMLAGVGNSMHTESLEKNYRDFNKFNFLYMWFSGWCTICLLCLYQPFMQLWLHGKGILPFPFVILICVYFYLLKMGDIRAMYSDAAGLWWENRYRAVGEAACNLTLNYLLVRVWGLYGIVIATLLPLFFINFLYGSGIVYKHYFKPYRVGDYFLTHLKYALVTLICAFATWLACTRVASFDNLLLQLLLRAGICLVVPNLLYLAFYSRTAAFREASDWIKALMRRHAQ